MRSVGARCTGNRVPEVLLEPFQQAGKCFKNLATKTVTVRGNSDVFVSEVIPRQVRKKKFTRIFLKIKKINKSKNQ